MIKRPLLKIFLVTVLVANSIVTSKGQTYVLIPDANFASYLTGLIPSAMNGNSLNISSTLVTTSTHSLYPAGHNISNLNGIQYFTSLTYLDCQLNSLTSLTTLPNSLTHLNCNANLIANLSTLSNSLTYLNCGGNSLTSLPTLPNSLSYLNCYGNSLSILPTLPNAISVFDCSYNVLSGLPTLPNSLQVLNCEYNSLTSLPALPNSLTNLQCNNNNIASLPTLPNSLQALYCDGNNIVCFPIFPNSLNSIAITPNPFTCLPNYVLPIMASYTTTPLCVTGNTNGCIVAGIKEFNLNNYQISVYPNPNSGAFRIQIDAEIENGELILINSLGQTVYEQGVKRGENNIIADKVSRGLYNYFILQNKQQIGNGKLIIE